MKNSRLLLLTILLLFFSLKVFSQEPRIPKFGKDLMEHLSMTSCSIDSSAHAVIIFDNGESNIKYNKEQGHFYVEIVRHTRIKILDKEGLKWADFSIPLYKSKKSSEKLQIIKGTTYNLRNGKIEKSKLSRNSQFLEEISDRLTLAKFTMPQVKEGSVIEFSYVVHSDFTYTLQHWEFQSDIPTLISNYSVVIPEYFKYNHRMGGYEKINFEERTGRETINFKEVTEAAGLGGGRQVSYNQVHYKTEKHIFYGYNIPKLRNEPYTDNVRNYQSRIDFELQYTQFPNTARKLYASNWDSSTKELVESRNFGKEIDGARFLTEEIHTIIRNISDPNEKLLAVFSHIQGKIKWNEQYRLWTDKGIRKAYNDGYGNSAEVNLCLIAALKEAGLDAFPIALSTRSAGLLHQWEISLSKLNHVIAGVQMENRIVTLDATKSFSAPNILPLECLNGSARIIDERRADWINLNLTSHSRSYDYLTLSISENNEVYGSVNQRFHNHSALSLFNTLIGDDDYDKLRGTLTKRYNNGAVDSIDVFQTVLPSPVINVKYNARIPESVIHAGNLIYLSPGVGMLRDSNPFVSPTRKLPINFHYPFIENQVFVYNIPEGYSIQELPENTSFQMLDGSGIYIYKVDTNDQQLTIAVSLVINKTLFIPSDYTEIREFFEMLVTKNREKVVLKKI